MLEKGNVAFFQQSAYGRQMGKIETGVCIERQEVGASCEWKWHVRWHRMGLKKAVILAVWSFTRKNTVKILT